MNWQTSICIGKEAMSINFQNINKPEPRLTSISAHTMFTKKLKRYGAKMGSEL